MNNEQIKRRMEEARGRMKDVAAKMTGNKTLDDRAQTDRAAGSTHADQDNARSAVKGAWKNR
jgi:uncharacterized protein YjbJ (UPF0337 family)